MIAFIRFMLPSFACVGAAILLSLLFAGVIEIGGRYL